MSPQERARLQLAPRPRTFDDVCERIEALESLAHAVADAQGTSQAEVRALKLGLHLEFASLRHQLGLPESALLKIDPDSSYNVISTAFAQRAAALYAQAKDPSNPMTVADVIAIARGELAHAKRDSDASKLRRWSERQWSVVLIILSGLVSAIVAMVLAHFGIHP